jgi:hypothetical protein
MGVVGNVSQSSGLSGCMGLLGKPVDVLLSDVLDLFDEFMLCVDAEVCAVAGVMTEFRSGSRVAGVLVEGVVGVRAGVLDAVGVESYALLSISCIMASSWDSYRLAADAMDFVGDLYSRDRRMSSSVPSLREVSTAFLMLSVSMKVW